MIRWPKITRIKYRPAGFSDRLDWRITKPGQAAGWVNGARQKSEATHETHEAD